MKMKKLCSLICILTLYISTVAANACQCDNVTEAQNSFSDLQDKLSNSSRITYIYIVRVPENFQPIIPVSRALIFRIATQFKSTKTFSVEDTLKVNILYAISNTKIYKTSICPDLRWGFILKDDDGNVLHSIFLGEDSTSDGESGYIDGSCVSIVTSLPKIFEEKMRD